uniref:Uncharacterized protein n=1 Tax=Arundo donax TaxID=35708 RepID=A0A0A9C0F2_ARUDO
MLLLKVVQRLPRPAQATTLSRRTSNCASHGTTLATISLLAMSSPGRHIGRGSMSISMPTGSLSLIGPPTLLSTWNTIQKETSKFQACYEQVERRHPSGIPYKEHLLEAQVCTHQGSQRTRHFSPLLVEGEKLPKVHGN